MQLPGRFPKKAFFTCETANPAQVKTLKTSWAVWLTTQIMVIFDHLRKMKRHGIRKKMYRNERNGGLSQEDLESLRIYIDVIDDSMLTPQKTGTRGAPLADGNTKKIKPLGFWGI